MEKMSNLLDTQNGTETTSENKTLLKRIPIPGSPFQMVESEKGYFLSIKNYRVTEPFETIEELEEYMEKEMWDLISRMTVVLIGICDEIKLHDKAYNGINRTTFAEGPTSNTDMQG